MANMITVRRVDTDADESDTTGIRETINAATISRFTSPDEDDLGNTIIHFNDKNLMWVWKRKLN